MMEGGGGREGVVCHCCEHPAPTPISCLRIVQWNKMAGLAHAFKRRYIVVMPYRPYPGMVSVGVGIRIGAPSRR